jgi:NADPH:quinone reductase-like Zn-dependent oxidoreductase
MSSFHREVSVPVSYAEARNIVLSQERGARPFVVRVHGAGVNPIDWKVREGHMKDFWPHKFPES